MRIHLLTIMVLACGTTMSLHAQDASAAADQITGFPDKFFAKINSKTADLDKQLTRQTEKYVNKLARREAKLKKKLFASDSNAANTLFANDPEQQYARYLQKLKTDSSQPIHSMGPEYLPNADSLNGVLGFLHTNSSLLSNKKVLPTDIQQSLDQLRQLQAKMQDADQIKQFIQQRREQIRQYLAGYANPPSALSGMYAGYSKQLYYYSQQVRQYREALNDPDKMLSIALSLLNKIPAFTSFMKSNSFLAGLFSIPSNYGEAEALTGLQTRDQVLSMMQASAGGPNAMSAIQNTLQTAQQDVNNMRDKLSKLGGGSGDMDIPNFKPNAQKTKTFFQRLEYGTNMQTAHAAYFFPTTTDLGLSVGYKINNKNTIGVGASYKVGWGTDISHINLSSQGAGLRSFLDMQIKKSFFASGGYEYNYQPAAGYSGQLNNINSWQQSGLLGISKIVSMNSKVFKKTKLQVLWDFLSYQQVPKTQPVKFRVGYSF
jgi:hypothetical protein